MFFDLRLTVFSVHDIVFRRFMMEENMHSALCQFIFSWKFLYYGFPIAFVYLQIGYWIGRVSWHVFKRGKSRGLLPLLCFPFSAYFDTNVGTYVDNSVRAIDQDLFRYEEKAYECFLAFTWPIKVFINSLQLAFIVIIVLLLTIRWIAKFMVFGTGDMFDAVARLGTKFGKYLAKKREERERDEMRRR